MVVKNYQGCQSRERISNVCFKGFSGKLFNVRCCVKYVCVIEINAGIKSRDCSPSLVMMHL